MQKSLCAIRSGRRPPRERLSYSARTWNNATALERPAIRQRKKTGHYGDQPVFTPTHKRCFCGHAASTGVESVEIHLLDAMQAGVRDGSLVKLKNARGEVILKAKLSDAVRRGVLYTPKGTWQASSATAQRHRWCGDDRRLSVNREPTAEKRTLVHFSAHFRSIERLFHP